MPPTLRRSADFTLDVRSSAPMKGKKKKRKSLGKSLPGIVVFKAAPVKKGPARLRGWDAEERRQREHLRAIREDGR
jgi:hypothetical protein